MPGNHADINNNIQRDMYKDLIKITYKDEMPTKQIKKEISDYLLILEWDISKFEKAIYAKLDKEQDMKKSITCKLKEEYFGNPDMELGNENSEYAILTTCIKYEADDIDVKGIYAHKDEIENYIKDTKILSKFHIDDGHHEITSLLNLFVSSLNIKAEHSESKRYSENAGKFRTYTDDEWMKNYPSPEPMKDERKKEIIEREEFRAKKRISNIMSKYQYILGISEDNIDELMNEIEKIPLFEEICNNRSICREKSDEEYKYHFLINGWPVRPL